MPLEKPPGFGSGSALISMAEPDGGDPHPDPDSMKNPVPDTDTRPSKSSPDSMIMEGWRIQMYDPDLDPTLKKSKDSIRRKKPDPTGSGSATLFKGHSHAI